MENNANELQHHLECEYCGKKGPDVCITMNPYVQELYGEDEEITICDDCLRELANDV